VKETFDIAVATNVLNWATDPSDVFAKARRVAKELLVTQGVIEGMSTVFLLTVALRAQRPVSWREVEGLARQAGWRLEERYAKHPVYIALFK
jgi:MinD-like ATPase involved in chromosome partitioning or flagellar assembly